MEEKAPVSDFERTVPSDEKYFRQELISITEISKIFITDKKGFLVESLSCQKVCCVERKYFMIVKQLREDFFSWYREREVKIVRINCARFFP